MRSLLSILIFGLTGLIIPPKASASCECIEIDTLPFTANRAGLYCVTRALRTPTLVDGILVTNSDVTIDLCGNTLYGNGGGTGVALVGTLQNVTVKNGTLRDWGTGVEGLTSTRLRYEKLNVLDSGGDGLRAGESSTLIDCNVRDGGGRGILVMRGSTVRRCVTEGNLGHATQAGGGGCTFEDCLCEGNLGNGFFSNGLDNTYIDCTAVGNGLAGILAGGGLVTGCNSMSNGTDGIRVEGAATISNTTASNNGNHGIQVYDRAVVRECTLSGNGGAGLLTESSLNRIEANNATNNDRGFEINGTDNVIVKNSACQNPGGDYIVPIGNKLGTLTTTPIGATPWDNFTCDEEKGRTLSPNLPTRGR
ncbi:MAG: right-handed parallel beta-helix repeat-containing protein [Acidobacteriota bacterium]